MIEGNIIIDLFEEYNSFWEEGEHVKYYEHKFDAYKNNKKKIYTYNKGYIFMEEPYVEKHPNGTSYGFSRGKGKEIDEDTLIKYFKKISKNEFLAKQMIHIPTT